MENRRLTAMLRCATLRYHDKRHETTVDIIYRPGYIWSQLHRGNQFPGLVGDGHVGRDQRKEVLPSDGGR